MKILWIILVILLVVVVAVFFTPGLLRPVEENRVSDGLKMVSEPVTSIEKVVVEAPEEVSEPKQKTEKFEIEADDDGFYVDDKRISSISVSKDSKVEILFKVKSSEVYFGGLDFRGNGIDTGKVDRGSSTNFEFVANNDFTVKSYWPRSDRLKSVLGVKIVVN